MSLFQKTIIKKYTQDLNSQKVQDAYTLYQAYFLNPTIQENIREAKEEQFQEGFLRELFGNILGYTLNPNPNFNLTTELKNISNSKKVDGAILIDNKAVAVIELKGTDTTDLAKIEVQAFGYKNNQPHCTYVITSNFEKLRFYIDNTIEFIEFNLFSLNREDFNLLWLCLSLKSIEQNIPKKIKDESVSKEDLITKQLYKDYSNFKQAIFNSLVERNKQFDKLILFKKTQKLLDRFLFIFFAEDRLLLPANLIVSINSEWKKLQDMRVEQSLFERYKLYFNDLNTGNAKQDIYSYNGGLFAPDEVLDNIFIEDDILYTHTQKLSNYDFQSEVDVNILGHIFENSLNEIEKITSEIEGQELDKSKTRRKKDGVFYTPKYITKYIVENTVGKLCQEKKEEIQLIEEQYINDKKKTTKIKKELLDKLNSYRSWLLQITICDPACGSGAFLNQALEFLISEHRYIDELQAKLLGASMILSDIENSILENNLFGVDINDESVEIAQLSLWLRTAQRNRKLNSLNNNIKCGNSLIDDINVAGAKAFNWQKEFPQVFAKGGFDVVIGNPPYGAFLTDIEKKYFKHSYEITEYNYDTYNFFFEQSIKILKDDCYLGFITPNTFLVVENGILLRKFLFERNKIVELYETFNVFSDAVVEPINIILKKTPSKLNDSFNVLSDGRNKGKIVSQTFLNEYIFKKYNLIFNYRATLKESNLYSKILRKSKPLSNFAKITTGIKPYQVGKGNPKQTNDIVKNKPYTSFEEKEGWNPLVRGTQIDRYITKWDGEYVKYGEWLAEPRNPEIFSKEKLLIRRTDDNLLCSFDEKGFIGINSVHCIQSLLPEIDNKFLLTQINSILSNWFFRHENFHMVGKPLAEIKVVFVERLPIIPSINSEMFIKNAKLILLSNKKLQDVSQKFQRTLQRKFNLEDLPKKLQDWYLLNYTDFVKELGKKKIKLSLSDEAEWEDYFLQESKKAQELKSKIDATDKEIDQMVYKLYELTEDEIKIVEGK